MFDCQGGFGFKGSCSCAAHASRPRVRFPLSPSPIGQRSQRQGDQGNQSTIPGKSDIKISSDVSRRGPSSQDRGGKKLRRRKGKHIATTGSTDAKRYTIEIEAAGRKKCKAKILIHLHLDEEQSKANGCESRDLQEAVSQLEEALRKKFQDQSCPCRSEGSDSTQDEAKKEKGCTFSVEAVWHEDTGESAEKSDEAPNSRRTVLNVILDCNTKKGKGLTKHDEWLRMQQGPDGVPRENQVAVWAHEIGHILFGGTTNNIDKFGRRESGEAFGDKQLEDIARAMGWDSRGHSKRKKDDEIKPFQDRRLMNAEPAKPDDGLSLDEICAVVGTYNLCKPQDCCPGVKGKKKGFRVPRGRVTPSSINEIEHPERHGRLVPTPRKAPVLARMVYGAGSGAVARRRTPITGLAGGAWLPTLNDSGVLFDGRRGGRPTRAVENVGLLEVVRGVGGFDLNEMGGGLEF